MKKKVNFKIYKKIPGAWAKGCPKTGVYMFDLKHKFTIVVCQETRKYRVYTAAPKRPFGVEPGKYNPDYWSDSYLLGMPMNVMKTICRNTVLVTRGMFNVGEGIDLHSIYWLINRDFVPGAWREKDMQIKAECLKECAEEVGVELELENTGLFSYLHDKASKNKLLVDDIGTDCSVNGIEIRFSHPKIDVWRKAAIKDYLGSLKSEGFKIDKCTAGMHIHYSGANVSRFSRIMYPGDQDAQKEFKRLCDILYPTNDRPSRNTYGVGSNIFKVNPEFNTVELRAWRATLNPSVFKKRIEIGNQIFRHVCSGRSLRTFFADLPRKYKKMYVDLVDACEYHDWGPRPQDAKRMCLMGELI